MTVDGGLLWGGTIALGVLVAGALHVLGVPLTQLTLLAVAIISLTSMLSFRGYALAVAS